MKLVYPKYYKEFRCIASRCEDTCCAGWEIVVDSDSADYYKTVSGEIGDRLRREMKTDSDGDIIFSLNNGRCPFLNSTNLCDIYSALGEKALCHTCTMFPRFVEDYGGTCETGLGLACPEAARLIVNETGERELLFEFNSDLPLPNDIDPEKYFELLSLRKTIFAVIDDNTMTFENRLMKILELAGESNPELPAVKNCVMKLQKLDILTPRWKKLISQIPEEKDFSQNVHQLENIAWYYIYRYFLRSVFDGDTLSKARLCVLACVVINAYSNKETVADIAHLFSKEVEYTADNIKNIFIQLKGNNNETF